MEHNTELSVVQIDRTNFREQCKLHNVKASDVLFNIIVWWINKLEELEDAGLAECEVARDVNLELASLFRRLTVKLYGDVAND